jgi:hypothetical protein
MSISDIPCSTLEDSVYRRVSVLAEQMLVDANFFSDEDESPLVDTLAHFLELLQEVSGVTDEQIKYAIAKYNYRPEPKHLLAWQKAAMEVQS